MRVGIVGLGHVGWSIGRGLALLRPDYSVVGCDKHLEKRQAFEQQTGFAADETSQHLLESSDLILLCIRTNQVADWLVAHGEEFRAEHTLVCLSAGISLAQLGESPGPQRPELCRAITNVNVAIRSGLTVMLDKTAEAPPARQVIVERMFRDLGEVFTVKSEDELDSLSVLSGCAPAAVAIFVQGLRAFGTSAGFDPEVATRIAVQCIGATAQLFQQTGLTPEDLMRRVAAPGGVVDRLLEAPESKRIEESASTWFGTILRDLTARG
jgi:pyrroline-5-carboxylate reductase